MSATKRRRLRTFPDLDATAFQHPHDVEATSALRAIPGLDRVIAKIMDYGLERVLYLDNIASSVRATPKMFGRLHRSLQWGCQILDMELPELYVTLDPVPNAYTYGHTRPFIVLTSGLVDMLDDEECFFVIGHELGHIKADHVLYTMMARQISTILTLVGQATLGLGALVGQGLSAALHNWYRKAELTADRAGLLCMQTMDPCLDAFMKMAGGTQRLIGEMDREAFLQQVQAYNQADDLFLHQAYKVLLTMYQTHPYPILRAKELDTWYHGGYRHLAGPAGLLES